jgi:hypothetical protein
MFQILLNYFLPPPSYTTGNPYEYLHISDSKSSMAGTRRFCTRATLLRWLGAEMRLVQ